MFVDAGVDVYCSHNVCPLRFGFCFLLNDLSEDSHYRAGVANKHFLFQNHCQGNCHFCIIIETLTISLY